MKIGMAITFLLLVLAGCSKDTDIPTDTHSANELRANAVEEKKVKPEEDAEAFMDRLSKEAGIDGLTSDEAVKKTMRDRKLERKEEKNTDTD